MRKKRRDAPTPERRGQLNERQRRFSIWTIWMVVLVMLLLQPLIVRAPEDEEIRRLLAEAHGRALATLSEHRSVLDALARLLIEHEVVEGDTLRQLLRPATVPRRETAVTAATVEHSPHHRTRHHA